MKKALKITVNGKIACVAGYNKNTMVNVQFGYNPHYKKANMPEYSYSIHGFKGGSDPYHLTWRKAKIKENQKIEIVFGDTKEKIDKPKKEKIKMIKKCGFCGKTKDEVDLLIEKNFIHIICDECVRKCMKLVEKEAP